MIIQVFCLFVVLLPVLAQSFDHPNAHLINDASCGVLKPGQRIHQGRNANLGEFPWMVYISTTKEYADGPDRYFSCGGTILNSKYVLSASHCFVGANATRISSILFIGEYNTKTNPDCVKDFCAPHVVLHKTEEIIIHPYFFSSNAGSDITLIRVRGEIQFNEFVAPICLEDGDFLTHAYTGEDAHVAGWGTYDFADINRTQLVMPDILQTLSVPIVDDDTCLGTMRSIAPSYEQYFVIESQVCAGGIPEYFAYMGDSGGPLMVVKQMDPEQPPRFYQIGVVSWGGLTVNVTSFESPTVYTRVRYYLPWVLDNMIP
uniref:Easter-7 n=1 Tax=Nilaparvata lugens TaxID=108931 RepID=A0A068F4D3_NILLU|nr:easter-7 [Nilaparvata lugens]APA33893.1 seminal fluid protein [Nilaparvata lugens]